MDILNQVLKRILGSNPTLKQGVMEARILELWPLSVGPQIAKHAKAVQLKGTTLFIAVDHSIWKQELHANKRLAITKLNEKLIEELGKPTGEKEVWIEDLFFLGSNPNASESQSKAFPRPRKK